MVQVAKCGASPYEYPPLGWVNPHQFHQGQIDHQPAVAHSASGNVVSAAPNREKKLMFACEINGRYHIRGAGAAHDQSRLTVNHRVPDGPSGVIFRVARQEYRPSHPRAELADSCLIKPGRSSIQLHNLRVNHSDSPSLARRC